MYCPSEKEFLELTKKGNLIPVYREILADLETPVSAYLKIAEKSAYSFLLESVEGQEKIARYSFVAENPELVFQSKGQTATITHYKNGKHSTQTKTILKSPLSFIREIMAQFKFVEVPNLPRFCGGLVGYMGYDTVRFFENLPRKPKDDLKLPDTIFVLAKNLIIFDHVNHKIKIVSAVFIHPSDSKAEKITAYKKAIFKINETIDKLYKPLTSSRQKKSTGRKSGNDLKVNSNLTDAQFQSIVRKAKHHIQIGDIIQVVLSQRFQTTLKVSPFSLYRALRSLNPSPYMYFLSFNGIHIVGSSPELLVRCEKGVVETRPIAGTRRRGKNDKEDERLGKELLSDPKERAEHTMLVDLGRNDLGRVCKQGTVKVSEFMAIEKYSHVMHIVSNVKGRLRFDKDPFDVLEATFPAGTVSGAPKIRAMEIIDELENVSRGPYAGCIGYISFSGNLDTCITIRTIIVKGNNAYIQAGAGIVADSKPDREYIETQNKAKAQIMAIQMAHDHIL